MMVGMSVVLKATEQASMMVKEMAKATEMAKAKESTVMAKAVPG